MPSTSITEPRGTIDTNHYSDRNELKGVNEPGGSPFSDQTFTYDDGFNRSNWTYGVTSTDYTVNNLNQYTAVGGASPTWNSDGGLATFGGNTYTYDALMRLTEVDNSSNRVYYTYDPLGRRTTKTVKDSTGSTWIADYAYHYDGSAEAVEYRDESPSATTWTHYLGLNGPLMRVRSVVPVKEWYYRDGQGSVSAVANNTGDLIEAYEYTAQGQAEILDNTGTVLSVTAVHSDIMYAGYFNDPETGNYFCNARFYNPTLGRFISRDPLSGAEFSQGANLYCYCRNNYLNATDPTGMCLLWQCPDTGEIRSLDFLNESDQDMVWGSPQNQARIAAQEAQLDGAINIAKALFWDVYSGINNAFSLGTGGIQVASAADLQGLSESTEAGMNIMHAGEGGPGLDAVLDSVNETFNRNADDGIDFANENLQDAITNFHNANEYSAIARDPSVLFPSSGGK